MKSERCYCFLGSHFIVAFFCVFLSFSSLLSFFISQDKQHGASAYSVDDKEKAIMLELYQNGPAEAAFTGTLFIFIHSCYRQLFFVLPFFLPSFSV